MQEELTKQGKWSDWISNQGNIESGKPLNYEGCLETLCEVLFPDGTTHIEPVSEWYWSDYGREWDIKAYRYWIPDTETQTEPKTEKDLYVNIWTDKDEEVLKELLAKKGAYESKMKSKLKNVVSEIHFYNMDSSDLMDAVIEHADELIDALQPYRKQK
jgi:hypothetical protein